jgi:hypothetical protein
VREWRVVLGLLVLLGLLGLLFLVLLLVLLGLLVLLVLLGLLRQGLVLLGLLRQVLVLLRQGLNLDPQQLEKGRTLALRSLEQIDDLRRSLQERLEQELAKAELRWPVDGANDQFVRLRVAAQQLADQLSQVEEMEARLQRLLEPGEGR